MENTEIKAREIIIKMQFQKEPLMFEQAKQCALTCVDEIINTYHSPMDDEQIEEWQQVKQEILNL